MRSVLFFVVAFAFTASVLAAETEKGVGKFCSIDPAQVKVGGEIGRRIDLTIQKNLLVIEVENQFLNAVSPEAESAVRLHRPRQTDRRHGELRAIQQGPQGDRAEGPPDQGTDRHATRRRLHRHVSGRDREFATSLMSMRWPTTSTPW